MARHAARHLIIGGGIIGCSVAYHLARRGEREVVLLERAGLTEGATWHAAGLVGQLRSTRNTTRMLMKSVAMYARLEAETGLACDWRQSGSLRLCASEARLLETRRLATMARSFGLEMRMISPAEAQALFPYISTDGLRGAAFIPSDGHVDPAGLCLSIAAGARLHGADIRQRVEVTDFATRNRRITGVETSEGLWEAETVTLAAGMWSREIGARLGLVIPACALEHQYIVTEPIPDFPQGLPTLRDPDRLVYYKPEAGGRLVVGGYEDNTRAFGEAGIPGHFLRQLLPDDLERFAPLAEKAALTTPILAEIGIRQVINGPIPYSADGDFVIGPVPGVENLMLATGFLYGIAAAGGAGEMIAEWITEGRPSLDLWPLDNRRFGPHHGARAFMYPRAVEHYAHHYKLRPPGAEPETGRNLRRSPFHDRLVAQGAVHGSKNGWERPLWFAPRGVAPVDLPDLLEPGWRPFVTAEHRAVREGVGLIDQSSFAKFELIGPGAPAAIQRLAVSNMDKPPGTVIYTQLCNAAGGIEADLTITRLEEERFYIVTGAGFGTHDGDWIRRHLPGDAWLSEVTSGFAVLTVAGPRARDLLAPVTEGDLSGPAFPFATARTLFVGAAPVRMIRIGYTGELGWELHIPTEFGAHVFETLTRAGAPLGLCHVGYRAIEGLRLEKGYLYWSRDITPDTTPYEAGLDGRVHLGRGGDFIGRAALERQKARGPARRLAVFTAQGCLPVTGGETIAHEGRAVSLATSAGYGATIDRTIVYGYLERDLWDAGDFSLEIFGQPHPLSLAARPLYDPEMIRLKA